MVFPFKNRPIIAYVPSTWEGGPVSEYDSRQQQLPNCLGVKHGLSMIHLLPPGITDRARKT
jgi:hypothetical protein